MKRGKDEEKAAMGPMFPRLHVNDAEKGGPRAPPRNKMALYEQLSIPSQRFSHSVLPFTPYSARANSGPHWNQSNGNERNSISSHQQPPKLISDKQHGQYSDVSSSLTQIDPSKKLNEEDFIVPVLARARTFRERVKNVDKNNVPLDNASDISQSMECSSFTGSGVIGHISKPERQPQREKNLTTKSDLIRVVSNSSINEKTEDLCEKTSLSFSCELGNNTSNCITSPKTGDRKLCTESVPSGGDSSAFASTRSFPLKDGNSVHHHLNDHNDGACRLESMERLNGTGSVTKSSALNDGLRLNITPDDVVGMIGQKHFWKARKAITNQQRVFATQIFELHRLIKVQKGMAVSTNAPEDISASAKTVVPAPPPKVPPSGFPHRSVKELPNPPNEENVFENLSQKNHSLKTSFPVVQTNKLPSSLSGSIDHSIPWWGQHQWLIPVMSPSEGLVYKPYPGHVFSGPPAYGGDYNLPGSSQMISNFSSHPQYHPLQPFPSPAAHSYFSSRGMPIMNMTVSSSSVEQSRQLSAKEVNCSIQHSKQRRRVLSDVDIDAWEDVEVQDSTASITNERLPQEGGVVVKARNVPKSMGSYTELSSVGHDPQPKHLAPQVIKAVPHHSKSATESAVRIFKSILEERKQFGCL